MSLAFGRAEAGLPVWVRLREEQARTKGRAGVDLRRDLVNLLSGFALCVPAAGACANLL